jgi:ribosome-binding ATPase YchF (GTP1/OBG family)
MKIASINIPELNPGKHNIKDTRLDEVDAITKAKKKTYIQVEVVQEEGSSDCDVILVNKDSRTDLILRDLELVETRLARSDDPAEKELFNKIKTLLEKEELISNASLSPAEKDILVKYGLLTNKPVVVAEKGDLDNLNALLAKAVSDGGYTSFFTTGEKETRAWLIKKGITAWEAAGAIHSDIQKGFIRAEIISLADFLASGGENRAKQAGKMRLEGKDYIMQDADLANFRFNK